MVILGVCALSVQTDGDGGGGGGEAARCQGRIQARAAAGTSTFQLACPRMSLQVLERADVVVWGVLAPLTRR